MQRKVLRRVVIISLQLLLFAVFLYADNNPASKNIMMDLRRRKPGDGSAGFVVVHQRQGWSPSETAVIICDM